MLRHLFLYIGVIFFAGFTEFSSAKTVVLIPGAASSAGRISLLGMERIFGNGEHWGYFDRMMLEIRRRGHRVEFCPRIPDEDQGSVEERARDCSRFLRGLPEGERVLLIGHSLGGLVGKSLLEDPRSAARVEALVTVSTPHRGTPLADLLFSDSRETLVLRSAALALGFSARAPRYVDELAWGKVRNRLNPLAVPVYSISNFTADFTSMPPFAWTGSHLSRVLSRIHPEEIRHDGIVPLASMVEGIHLGEVEADHMESACILQGQWSRGCEQVLHLLLPLLRNRGE